MQNIFWIKLPLSQPCRNFAEQERSSLKCSFSVAWAAMDLEFVDIDTQDRIHVDGIEKYSVKELLCTSDEEGPEASVSNKTRNRFEQVATCRQRTK